jgi:hypothetical protein
MLSHSLLKRCIRCLIDKPRSDFYRNKRKQDGLCLRCKSCYTLPAIRPTLEQRFWSKVLKTDTCWLWIAAKWPNGYGHFAIRPVHSLAHRVAWELTYGPIPDGLLVLHDCPGGDNKACVNPAHLWLGTHADNYHDGLQKGQYPPEKLLRGKANHMTKLSETQRAELLYLYYEQGWRKYQLAQRYNVSGPTIIYHIKHDPYP